MNNYIDVISKINLRDQTKIWLCEIIGIENYFYREINERKSYVKNLNKYITIFEYIDKILIILSATSGVVLIISFTTIVGVTVGIISASYTLIFSIAKGLIKILLKITRNKKKNHDNIHMLAKSKLNSVETLISEALNDMEISHEEFIIILKEKVKYEKMKYILESEKQEKFTKLQSIKSTIKNNLTLYWSPL